VILRDKVTIREVIAGNGIPDIYTVEKIARSRNVHLWLPVAAENDVWIIDLSTMIDIFPDHSERLGLDLAGANASQLAFKLLLGIAGANERHYAKNNKTQSESNWYEGLNECIKTHEGIAAYLTSSLLRGDGQGTELLPDFVPAEGANRFRRKLIYFCDYFRRTSAERLLQMDSEIGPGAILIKPVKLVMLFLVPQGQYQKHLHTLANLARLLHKRDFRDGNLGI